MSRARALWWAGTGVVSVGVLVAGWSLVLSPVRDDAARARADAQAVTDQNAVRRAEAAHLAEEATRMPELETELADLRRQFPTALELDAFVRRLADLAARSGGTVQSVSRGEPTLVQAAADGEAVTWSGEYLYAVSVTLVVDGTRQQQLDYVRDLQAIDDRLFLVTAVDGLGTERSTVTGSTFVLLDAVAVSGGGAGDVADVSGEAAAP
ncbi:hypothetical protein [Cellulomonas sp.]|uniref:hypothetical protein n=1 Tax=Cellulomonas sp. TaxID=40001 RepID=UPI002D5D7038|nr:hypothetical protein [Cellulomonas sp.]HYQ76878.1 hypothetical protein [Cellulomonas sp.]